MDIHERELFKMSENIFDEFMKIRKEVNNIANIKEKRIDPYENSEEYKMGFVAGVKLMASIFFNI